MTIGIGKPGPPGLVLLVLVLIANIASRWVLSRGAVRPKRIVT